jgi:hypothetical protein
VWYFLLCQRIAPVIEERHFVYFRRHVLPGLRHAPAESLLRFVA